MALKENYKDDILDTSQNVKRKYQMENNGDGTVSFTDVTEYTQQGDSFGSGDINATNGKVNTLDSAVTTLNANLDGFKFYPTGTELVALVADDSFYKDANDKYVLADSQTGQQMIENEPSTYKALASTEETHGEVGADTCSPFNKGFNSFAEVSDNLKNGKTVSETFTSEEDGIYLVAVGGSASGGMIGRGTFTISNSTTLTSSSRIASGSALGSGLIWRIVKATSTSCVVSFTVSGGGTMAGNISVVRIG